MESVGKERTMKKSRPSGLVENNSAQVSRVKELFEEWLQDSSGYDEENWPQLEQDFNKNHSKSHKLINE